MQPAWQHSCTLPFAYNCMEETLGRNIIHNHSIPPLPPPPPSPPPPSLSLSLLSFRPTNASQITKRPWTDRYKNRVELLFPRRFEVLLHRQTLLSFRATSVSQIIKRRWSENQSLQTWQCTITSFSKNSLSLTLPSALSSLLVCAPQFQEPSQCPLSPTNFFEIFMCLLSPKRRHPGISFHQPQRQGQAWRDAHLTTRWQSDV